MTRRPFSRQSYAERLAGESLGVFREALVRHMTTEKALLRHALREIVALRDGEQPLSVQAAAIAAAALEATGDGASGDSQA